ncbi:entericidin A/B family lipoprotein [Rhodospira trueperi]|uniref:Predicted small secreted protein n=1 Tax=Rhodospira trueperi TaxID=69960 RepID=A0A1G6X4U5_9PROT|nr:entericidin A/B family lipoprotein [Rhodospira trueperi]SDD73172.1 Predicted small secreted protein [Rhodospira trueperi]
MTTKCSSMPVVAAVLAGALALAACSTVEGIGKDISAGGQVLSNTARDVKEKM